MSGNVIDTCPDFPNNDTSPDQSPLSGEVSQSTVLDGWDATVSQIGNEQGRPASLQVGYSEVPGISSASPEFDEAKCALDACMAAWYEARKGHGGQVVTSISVIRLAIASVLTAQHDAKITGAAKLMGITQGILYNIYAVRKSSKIAHDTTVAEPIQNFHDAIERALAPYQGRSVELAEAVRALLSHLGVEPISVQPDTERGDIEIPQGDFKAAMRVVLKRFGDHTISEIRQILAENGYPEVAVRREKDDPFTRAEREILAPGLLGEDETAPGTTADDGL